MRYGLCVLCLAGCGSVVPGTLASLSGLSPLEADPAGFAARAELPDGIALRPGGALLALSATRADGTTASGRFAFVPDTGPEPASWRIDPARIPELRALQARIRSWEEADPEGTTGQLSIEVVPCAVGTGPDPDGRIDLWLRLSPEAPFRQVVRGLRVADALETAGDGTLAPCDGTAAP